MRSANLTTNAKASGRKLTLLIIKDLERDRELWMADVVRKSELLGQHDTINTKWIPQNQDYQVKITGVVSVKSQPDPSTGSASFDTSTAGDVGVDSTTSTAGGGKVKREKRDHTTTGVGPRTTLYAITPGKPVVKTDLVDMEEDEDTEVEVKKDLNNHELAELLKRMEIMHRIKEIEHAQHLRDAELASVRRVVAKEPADRAHTGLYGLRENNLVENMIKAECAKHKVWTHPVSGREETAGEREVRMMLYDMIVTSLQNFKAMYSGEHVGDNYAVLRNVMTFGAPSSKRMKIDLTKKLGNYHKQNNQGYQEYELGLQHLSNDLCAVGMVMKEDELTLRLIAGMTSDKRYEKECREVSERDESYATCHSVFVQRAQALSNLTSTFKKKDEANAVDAGPKGKGGGRQRRKGS